MEWVYGVIFFAILISILLGLVLTMNRNDD